jgi:hypothetical protein
MTQVAADAFGMGSGGLSGASESQLTHQSVSKATFLLYFAAAIDIVAA